METNGKAQPRAPSGGTRRLPKVTQVNGRSRARHSRAPHGPLPAPGPLSPSPTGALSPSADRYVWCHPRAQTPQPGALRGRPPPAPQPHARCPQRGRGGGSGARAGPGLPCRGRAGRRRPCRALPHSRSPTSRILTSFFMAPLAGRGAAHIGLTPEGSGAAAAREPLTVPAPHARSPPPPLPNRRRRRLAAGSLRRLPRDSPGGCAGRRRPEVICAAPGDSSPREEELGCPGLPSEVSASRTLTRCCAGQLSVSGTQRHSPSDAKRSLSNRVVICEENITGCCSWAIQHSQRCPAGCLCCSCSFSRWIR